jgi:hypothetical protein
MATLRGSCHCGAVRVSLETAIPVDEIQVRACDCTFCRRHGAKSATDPNGLLTFTFPRGGIAHYRFGHRTADILICQTCGVYVGAVTDKQPPRGTLNVVGTRIEGLRDRAPDVVSLDHENREARLARRRAKWTPMKVVELAESA